MAVAAVGVAISAYGAYQQQKLGKKAAAAQQRANELQVQAAEKEQRLQDIRTARERRARVRELIRRRAAVVSRAESQGAGAAGASAVPGSVGSLTSQAGSEISFLNQAQELGAQAFGLNKQASVFDSAAIGYKQQASTYGAIAGFGGTIIQNRQAIGDFGRDIFSQATTNQGPTPGETGYGTPF